MASASGKFVFFSLAAFIMYLLYTSSNTSTSLSNNLTLSKDPVIENKNVSTEPGVTLSARQQLLVGSVLDLFAGRPSLEKLQLWKDDAVFEDPIAKALGRKEFEPQWYGLQTAFSAIERISHSVTSDGNPIVMNMKTKYTIKGVNTSKIIESVVMIETSPDAKSDENAKISKVQDKWNGELPESSFADAFRRLNAKTMPHVVGVPGSKEEDAAKGN